MFSKRRKWKPKSIVFIKIMNNKVYLTFQNLVLSTTFDEFQINVNRNISLQFTATYTKHSHVQRQMQKTNAERKKLSIRVKVIGSSLRGQMCSPKPHPRCLHSSCWRRDVRCLSCLSSPVSFCPSTFILDALSSSLSSHNLAACSTTTPASSCACFLHHRLIVRDTPPPSSPLSVMAIFTPKSSIFLLKTFATPSFASNSPQPTTNQPSHLF